jgi:L-cysteine/cystine lyase
LEAILERAADLADRFAAALADAGYTVAPRGRSTLIAFEYPDPEAARERLAAAGVAVRNLPGHPYLRASVGAWNDESDLERLLAAL